MTADEQAALAEHKARVQRIRGLIDELKRELIAQADALILAGERVWTELDIQMILQDQTRVLEEWAAHQCRQLEEMGAERYFALWGARMELENEHRAARRQGRKCGG